MQIELNSPLLGGDARRAEGAKTEKHGLKLEIQISPTLNPSPKEGGT